MMTTHAYNSDSDPESERDEDTPAGALALPPKLCSGREVFCTTRNVAYHPIDQIQYTRFQMTSSEVVHGGLGQQNCHRRRGWVPRTQARADGCTRI